MGEGREVSGFRSPPLKIFIMKKNKKSEGNKKLTKQEKQRSKQSKGRAIKGKSPEDRVQNRRHPKPNEMEAVMESYYNVELRPNPNAKPLHDQSPSTDPYLSHQDEKSVLGAKSALQKAISKNLPDYFESDFGGSTLRKNSGAQQRNSWTKSKQKNLTNNKKMNSSSSKLMAQTFMERSEKSHSKDLLFRKTRICHRSFEKKSAHKKNLKKKQISNKNPEAKGKQNKQKRSKTPIANKTKPKEKTGEYLKVRNSQSPTYSNFRNSFKKQVFMEETPSSFFGLVSGKRSQIKAYYVDFMSKVCGELLLNRQSFELAQHYFFANLQYYLKEPSKIQTLSLASIVLALKVDDSVIAKPLFREIVSKSHQDSDKNKNSSLDNKVNSCTSLSASRQQFLRKLNLIKKKPTHRGFQHIKKIHSLLAVHQIDAPPRQQLIDMEKKICSSLKYRLTPKTMSYTIDYMTFLWDDFLVRTVKEKDVEVLLFRGEGEKRKFSYLVQMCNLYILEEFEERNINSFILTTIYILIRIQMENSQNHSTMGLSMIRQNLKQSTNILYVDSVGTNAIFTKFLQEIKFRMEDIAYFCQKVPKYLEEKLLEVFTIDRAENHEESLRVHTHNPKLYHFFNPGLGD